MDVCTTQIQVVSLCTTKIFSLQSMGFNFLLPKLYWNTSKRVKWIAFFSAVFIIFQPRGCFGTCPCCNALTPTQHESGTAVSVHATPVYTQRYAQILNFYNFETVFSLSKCESLFDSTLQTGTYDYIASSHQVKSKSDSQHCQFISVSKLYLLHSFEWPLHAATTVGIQISVVHAMHHGQVPIHPLSQYLQKCVCTLRFCLFKDVINIVTVGYYYFVRCRKTSIRCQE